MKTTIISDGLARRLARDFKLESFYVDGGIDADLVATVKAMEPPADCRDQWAFRADQRALLDYMFINGPRDRPTGWYSVRLDFDTQVPWAYGR